MAEERVPLADAPTPFVDPRDPTVRGVALTPPMVAWLAAALAVACVLVAWPVLAQLYWIERAGSLLDRNIVNGDTAALAQAEQILGLVATPGGSPAEAPPPRAGSAADSPGYWRTYGAVAARAPSEAAFQQLKAARERGRLDRMGHLWLGEMAAATGHWDVASEEYGRVDAVNILVKRGNEAAAEHRQEAAVRWYATAATSLLAAIDAEQAAPGGDEWSDELSPQGSGRTILLLRIGLGLLRSGAGESAVPVLERAESEIHARPPGPRDQQAIRFALAEALARTLPSDPTTSRAPRARIDRLLHQAVSAEETGWARLQEARVRLLVGERPLGLRALRIAVRLDPRSVEARMTLGGLLESDGLLSLARDQYALGLKAVPNDPWLSPAWAKTSYATIDPALALPRLKAAGETTTRDPDLFAALGDCLLDLGAPAAARAAYREGLLRAPGSEVLRDRMTRFARPTGRIF